MSDIYRTDLTPEEVAAGFTLTDVPNPKGHYFLEPRNIQAVVKPLSPTQRLIKMESPIDGTISYAHQAYIDNVGSDNWRPVAQAAYSVSEAASRLPASPATIDAKYGWTKNL
ncbi:hypothetical protein ACES2J_06160 [Bdellovibrio bacteriovorus]|uniref:hypothetical protein n=1 Tax=Bdellovibrio bacteriovorus TaxID=959 RepID=UPI0035A743AE